MRTDHRTYFNEYYSCQTVAYGGPSDAEITFSYNLNYKENYIILQSKLDIGLADE